MKIRKGFGNVKSLSIYPMVSDKETIGIQLNRGEAICFAKNILSAALDCDKVDITGFRTRRMITVSGKRSK